MAQARLTCGMCGASLTLRDTVCPNCGSPVELPGEREHGPAEGREPRAGRRPAEERAPRGGRGPGDERAPRGGHGLGEGREPRAGHGLGEGREPRGGHGLGEGREPRAGKRPPPPAKPAPRRDPWPYVALAAIIVLVAVVVFTQWGRAPAPTPVAAQVPAALPAQTPDPSQLLRLQQAVQADPKDADTRVKLANALQDAGQFGSAAENYRNYLHLRPQDPDARVDLGICLYQMGLTDSTKAAFLYRSAVQEMRTAIAGTPTHQPAAFNLGIVYLQLGNLDSSNVWFRRTVALNKTSDLGMRAQRILGQHQLAQ